MICKLIVGLDKPNLVRREKDGGQKLYQNRLKHDREPNYEPQVLGTYPDCSNDNFSLQRAGH